MVSIRSFKLRASFFIGAILVRITQKLGDCPRVFLDLGRTVGWHTQPYPGYRHDGSLNEAQWFYAPTGRKGIAQGKAKRRPGIRCARNNPSPERAIPAVRQSMCTCSALSGLWRIGASAYLRAIAYDPGWRFALPWAISLCPVGANDPVTDR